MKCLQLKSVLVVGLLAAAMPALSANINSVNLANYSLTGTYSLPSYEAAEASAVTHNWDTDTLFVLGDEGDMLVEVSKTGAQLSSMILGGFDDTEGLTYIGGNQFIVTEEREQDAYLLTYSAGGAVTRSSLQSADMGPYVGNRGIEGISYDPMTGHYFTVKEKSPQAVNQVELQLGKPGTATVTPVFSPDLGLSDLSDIQVLSTVLSLGSADYENLLIFSQESATLLEVSRNGDILSSLNLSAIADDIEGVTIDADGTIFLVGETPELYALTAVPVPAAAWLFASGLAGLGWIRKKKALL